MNYYCMKIAPAGWAVLSPLLCFLPACRLQPQKDQTRTWRFLFQFQGILIRWRALSKSCGLTELSFLICKLVCLGEIISKALFKISMSKILVRITWVIMTRAGFFFKEKSAFCSACRVTCLGPLKKIILLMRS